MRIVIFGGAGFIGLNIAQCLFERGHVVTLFDQADVPPPARRAFARYEEQLRAVRGDVTDAVAVDAAIGTDCHAIVMGAAITAGPERDAAEPERILAVNLAAQVPILRAARQAGVRRVINLSSAAAYGASGQCYPLLDEDTPCAPTSLYAVTKFASERVAARLADLWGIDVVSVRLSGAFGLFEGRGGVRDTPSPQAAIVDCLTRGAPALLSDPGLRDWIYAPDAAEAIALLIAAEKPGHALYNLSSGVSYTAAAWGVALAKSRPGFVCRVAEAGEAPTVRVHGPVRAPLSVARFANEFGWRTRFGCDASAADMIGRLNNLDDGRIG